MKVLYRELIKIARQMTGSENIFGYKSTVANQLYLLYCFSGKIYFTEKIHKQVKYLWYGIISCQILFSFVVGWTYLWYEAAKNDLVVMLNVANAIGGLLLGAIMIPLIVYLHSNNIETMIDRVDNILTIGRISNIYQNKVAADAKQNLLAFFGLCAVFLTINFSICFLDIAVLFEEDKVKNYLYYAFPVFLVQKYSGIGSYLIFNGISTLFFVMMSIEGWSTLGMISYWSTVWYDELISVRDELNTAMRDLNVRFGENARCSNDWNKDYQSILKRSIQRFQKITHLINDMRRFYEVFGSVMISGVYLFGVFFLYNSFSNDISTVLMLKYASGFLASITLVFIFYWIGQKLDNSVSEVSMAIYSTPWYRSVKVRKNVYIFLCQTQTVKIFTIFKVYWLVLNNFSRYVHALMSYTNILLKLTNK